MKVNLTGVSQSEWVQYCLTASPPLLLTPRSRRFYCPFIVEPSFFIMVSPFIVEPSFFILASPFIMELCFIIMDGVSLDG